MIYKKIAPHPMLPPVGKIYTSRYVYGACCICGTSNNDAKYKTIDKDLAIYTIFCADGMTFFDVCDSCYKETIKLCEHLYNTIEDLPLYINSDNMFIKHFVEKTLKE